MGLTPGTSTNPQVLSRRQALLLGLTVPILPLVGGCRASLPPSPAADTRSDALALLHSSATAHGLTAYAAVNDLNVSYSGHWRRLVGMLQPALVDSGFRGGSEERLLLREGVIAQSHSGPKGHKQVVRLAPANGASRTQVWFNGEEAHDRERNDAAALVADAYSLFLLGPLLLVGNTHPRRTIRAAMASPTHVQQDGHTSHCDVLNLTLTPGFGNSASDEVALYIDHETRLMRRVRMTLNGLESTQGALVDIDTSGHLAVHGILWPTLFHERLLRPAPLDVHTWNLTGLDINRGESYADVSGADFAGKAVLPATPLVT